MRCHSHRSSPLPSLLSEMAHYLESSDTIDLARVVEVDNFQAQGGQLSEAMLERIYKNEFQKSGHLMFDAPESPPFQLPSDFLKDMERELIGHDQERFMRSRDIYCSRKLALDFSPSDALSEKNKNALYSLFEKYAGMSLDMIIQCYPMAGSLLSEAYRFLYSVTAYEKFVHTKFTGQKRFSIEGSETALLALYLLKILSMSRQQSMHVGMAHRGRLAALTTVFHKPFHHLFLEFMGRDDIVDRDSIELPVMGDVKYHRGYTYIDPLSQSKLVLLSNPSHLESIYPILLGYTRAEQEKNGPDSSISVLFHGDASLAGQGVVYESLQMSRLPGFNVGGAYHIVVDNQVGFTASSTESRSTSRPTDIFRSFSIPVIHVRNEHPQSMLKAVLIAHEIRQTFGIDVALRVLGHRKWGHNESDDPTFTQPRLYKKLAEQELLSSFDCFRKECELSDVDCQAIEKEVQSHLSNEFALAQSKANQKPHETDISTTTYGDREIHTQDVAVRKNVDVESLLSIFTKTVLKTPEKFQIHPRIKQLLEKRREALEHHGAHAHIDWGFAELFAFALLVLEGVHVRLVGQDVERGTFSHRHAIFNDQGSDEKWSPLSQIGSFQAYNSILSEYGSLAFEYGYSLVSERKSLPLWEAQFGDFANGAQIVFDQYISSGMEKWGNRSNLTLLLPHGYEGQGPEHSSARLERLLSLAANDNMMIAYPSLPATYSQLLIRQASSSKPLIILTPKAHLRDPRAISSVSDCCASDLFSLRIMGGEIKKSAAFQNIIFSTGKFALELYDFICKEKLDESVAIVSIEILYPFPAQEIAPFIQMCQNKIIWAQEEPINMGAWSYISSRFNQLLQTAGKSEVSCVARPESSSPATGYHDRHELELIAMKQKILTLIN